MEFTEVSVNHATMKMILMVIRNLTLEWNLSQRKMLIFSILVMLKRVGFSMSIKGSHHSKIDRQFIVVKNPCTRYGKREFIACISYHSLKVECSASLHVKRSHHGKWIAGLYQRS